MEITSVREEDYDAEGRERIVSGGDGNVEEGKEGDLPQGKISGEGWLVIRERWGGKGRRPTVGEDGAGREKMPQGWKGGGGEGGRGKVRDGKGGEER